MRTQFAIVLATILVLSGCEDSQTQRTASGKPSAERERELVLIDGYYSSDIGLAEQSLLALTDYYSTLHVDGVGGTLGLTHTRLFLLYSHMSRTNNAARHRELALAHYHGAPSQTADERWRELLDAVELSDRNREVKWRVQR